MDNATETQEAKLEKARHRSPNYPGVSLKLAVAKITKWFEQDGVVASPKDAALKHMGFDKLTGDAGRLLSALKSFGLILETDGRIKLNQRGIDIVAYKHGEPKRDAALKAAALSPPIYKELAKEYPGLSVSDTTLKSVLIADKKFNPKSVDDFTRGLRTTLAFAGLSNTPAIESQRDKEDGADNLRPQPKVGDHVQWVSGGALQFSEPMRVRGLSDDGEWVFIEGSDTGLPVEELTIEEPAKDIKSAAAKVPPVNIELRHPQQKQLLTQALVISIPRDFRVDISVKGDELKREDLNRIKSQFNRWIEGMEEAFD